MIYPALKVEAVIRGISPKELVNQMILSSLSSKAKEFLRDRDPIPKEAGISIAIETEKPNSDHEKTGSVSRIPFKYHAKSDHEETESVKYTTHQYTELDDVPKRPPIIFRTKSDTENPKT